MVKLIQVYRLKNHQNLGLLKLTPSTWFDSADMWKFSLSTRQKLIKIPRGFNAHWVALLCEVTTFWELRFLGVLSRENWNSNNQRAMQRGKEKSIVFILISDFSLNFLCSCLKNWSNSMLTANFGLVFPLLLLHCTVSVFCWLILLFFHII